MKDLRLHEGELNIMELLWTNKSLAAKDIAKIIKEYVGWEKNTTYTVIHRLIEKGVILREDPGFMCTAIVTKRMVQQSETTNLIDRLYNGSMGEFFSEFLRLQDLSAEDLYVLEKIVREQRV